MKYRAIALAAGLLAAHTAANAWFFFFVPGSVTNAVAEKIRGTPPPVAEKAPADMECVEAGLGPGDKLTVPGKGQLQIVRILRRSETCPTTEQPMLAEVAPAQ